VTHKHLFFGCAFAGFLGLCLVGFILIALALIGFLQPAMAVAIINLLVDIVVGVFTVWGLFWAASEFSEQSLRSQLNLLLGEAQDVNGEMRCTPLHRTQISVTGQRIQQEGDVLGKIKIGLFLENTRPRAAQRIQLRIEIRSVPPIRDVYPDERTFTLNYHPNYTETKVILRFEDDLVVYQGEELFLGVLHVDWLDPALPNTCELRYVINKAEGRPDVGLHNIRVNW
jgi:hypothetical protein